MKRNFIRIAGAQIPVTMDVQKNIITIKTAIDWAVDNSVDYIITPEASLSGYQENFNTTELIDALAEIEEYQKAKNIGLGLGTLWEELNRDGTTQLENQLRFYTKGGRLHGRHGKTILCPLDDKIGIVASGAIRHTFLDTDDPNLIIPVAGVLCNDLYGKQGAVQLMAELHKYNYKIYIHATNAEREVSDTYDSVYKEYHNALLRLVSYLSKTRAILTVDNSINIDGTHSDKTSSTSGVLAYGEWQKTVPEGIQYFYHDFPLDIYAVPADEPDGNLI